MRRKSLGVFVFARVELGLEPLATGADSVTVALIRRAGAGVVVVPREFDD